jgi:glutamate 5-kinase
VNLVAAQLLVILTDVDGMHREPPRAGEPKPPLFDVIEKITPSVERAAQGSASAFGRGGMTTKLQAARAAARSGAATVLCSGLARDSLLAACRGESVGTLIRAGDRMQSRKHWLAFTARVRGKLHVDAGAAGALTRRGKSLLPAGITRVDGRFAIGDPVACIDPEGAEVARGLVAYSSEEIARIAGQSASKITTVLGYSNGDAVIHRNDLALQDPA